MKKILSLLAVILLAIAGTYGQSPSPGIFNYQGVARNSVGNVLVNKTITLRLTIRDGAAAGPLLYQESRTVTTNPFGLFNVQVGSGGTITQVGTIAGVNWGVNTKFIQVEIDPNGGSSFINIGAAQIASVPYSLYSSLANDLVLPFNKTQADNGTLFKITNSGNNTGSTALEGLTNSTQANAAAIIGTVTNTSPGGFSTGVRGINNGIGGLGIGVWGSQNGSGYGVYGTTPGGWAIRGEAATSGVGVYGSSSSGTGGRFLSTSGLALHTSGGGVRLQNINEAANRILATIPGDGTATWQDPAAVGIVTGSGTVNFVPKWTPVGTNLGNSQIFDNGTDVGIGTITPFSKLTVVQGNSGVNIGGGPITGTEVKFLNFGTAHMSIYNRGNNALTFANTSALSQTNVLGTELMTLTSAGSLGIGTTTPTARFSVNEQFKVQTNGTVQYANAVNPMMIMFESGTGNPDRMVVSHSPAFPTWGLQYQDGPDKFNFLSSGTSVLTADLGNQRVGVGAITPNAKLNTVGTGPLYTPLISVQSHQTAILAENNTASGSLNAGIVSYANGSTLANRGVFGVAGGTGTAFNIGVGGIANAVSTGSNYGIVGFGANGANNWAGAFFGRVQIQDGTQGVNRLFFDDGAGNGTGEWRTLAGAGIVGGSGTLNFVTKWTPDGNNIGNSQIFDNGSTVSVSGGGFVASNSLSILTTPASPTNTSVSLITASQAGGVYLENATGDLHVTANFNNVGIGNKIMTFEDGSLNVGIGTVAPSHRLSVEHGGFDGIVSRSTAAYSIVDIDAFNNDAALRYYNNGSMDWHVGVGLLPGPSGLGFYDPKAGSYRMAIMNTTGNVGVSTTAPTARMHVIGEAGATYSSPTAGVVGISPAVIGEQTDPGGYDKTGLVGYAEGGVLENFGVWGVAGTTATAGNVGGGFVSRSNTANPRYGVYADAGTVAANSWAGWFNGRVRISDGTQGVNRLFFDDGAGIGTGEWRTPAGAGLVSGSGTLNFVPKWTPDGVTLGNSQITDDGNVVTVGSVLGGGSSLNVRTTTGGSLEPSIFIGVGQFGGIYTEQGTGMIHFTANNSDAAAGTKIMTLDDDGFNGVGIGTTAPAAKLHAYSATTTGPDAVLGESDNTNGSAVAVRGVITSTAPGGFSAGVRGINNGTGGLGIGVYGSQNGSGWGVYGTAPSGIGVNGNSTSGTGVNGVSSTGFAGNFQNTNAANTVAALRAFNAASNINAVGVHAISGGGSGYGPLFASGLIAESFGNRGMLGVSNANTGVHGASNTGIGVVGESYASTGNAGVLGFGLNTNNFGVVGNAAAGTGAGGYFTGGTTALRTLGGVQLTGIGEAPNRILATVPGTGQATWEDAATVGIVSGSGTLNFLAKWTPNGTTLGNSQVFDNGNIVNVGATTFSGATDYSLMIEPAAISPEASLIFASAAGQANGIFTDNNGEMHFTANSGSIGTSQIIMTMEDATLNVGIGTTAPAAKLHALSTAPDAVLGESSNTAANAVAVRGVITSAAPGGFSSAVRGMNNGTGGLGIGVWGSQNGGGWGVYGSTPSGIGVNGNSNTGTGVNGSSTSGIGVNGASSTSNAGNFTSTSGANAVPTVRSFNPSGNIGAWSMYALSQGTNAYPGNNNSAAIVAESQGNSVGLVASAISNNSIRSASLLNNSIVGEGWAPGMAGIFGTGLFGGTYGVVGNAAAGTGAGGFFTGGTTALRTIGGVQLTGIGEAANRILATVPGTGQATWEDPSTVGIVSGSGTLNFIPKWTPNGTTLGNSLIFDDGTNVGIGTVVPVASLDIDNAAVGKGSLRVNQDNELVIPAFKALSEGPVVNDLSLVGPNWGDNSIFAQRGSRLAGTTYGIVGPGAIAGYSQDFTAVKAMSTNGTGIFASSSTANAVRAFSFSGTSIRSTTATGLSLHTSGNIRLDGIGENVGYILTSDAAGNATWQENTSLSVGISGHFLTAALVVPSGPPLPVTTWTNLIEDGGANYNVGTGEYTITKTGVYQVNASLFFDPFTANSSASAINLVINGVTQHQGIDNNVVAGFRSNPKLAIAQRFNAGDVLRVDVFQLSGVNQTINAGYFANQFSIQFLHK